MVFPFPIQGHINPMLQFSKRLASKGLLVTLVTTSLFGSKFTQSRSSFITVEIISDGTEEVASSKNVDSYLERFEAVASIGLAKLIEDKKRVGYPLKCLVYDSTIPWALNVARKFGIYGASFFTQSCAVNLIYWQVYNGTLKVPDKNECMVSLPGLPLINVGDFPSFVYQVGSYPALEKLVLGQFSNCGHAEWRFFNTFDRLENEVLNWMTSQWPVKTVGPAIPSMYLDKRLEEDKDYELSLFDPEVEACIQWLDTKEHGSTIYVSMGSLAALGQDQMGELARGLIQCNKNFLWVVRSSEENKLPLRFKEDSLEKGLVVNWCPQLAVLAHKAVGCFLTHCGFNSTLEAISLGVPMVAMPQWTDQPTNAKYLSDVWHVGVRVKVDESGIVSRDEIASKIREVMEEEKGDEIKSNAIKWKELAKEAMEEGGSSDTNIEEFVASLLNS